MKIANNEQFQKLVEELEKNPALAKGFKKGTVLTNFTQQWENIASILNASGLPIRDGDGWQKNEELVTEVLGVDLAIEMQTNVDSDNILVEQEDASTSQNGSSLRVTPSGSMTTTTVHRKKNC